MLLVCQKLIVVRPRSVQDKLALMFCHNKDWHILNSDMYSVVHIQDEKFHFQLKNDYDAPIITMAQKDFHTYFYLGFCITAHASQGSTIHEPFTIYDWNHRYFNDTAKYVCLSRATTIEHINIMC